MEYGLWNLPTGFWQASNQTSIPVDAIGRPAYYAQSNTLPVFHTSFNGKIVERVKQLKENKLNNAFCTLDAYKIFT